MLRILSLLLLLFAAIAPASSAAPPPATYRIGGIVVDSLTGQPLSLAEVTLSPATALDDVQTFLTAPDGRFLFTNLAPGKYRLMAGRRGYAVQGFNAHESYMTAIVAGPGQDSEHLRFRLSPSAALTGTISDQWNDPVRGAAVILYQQGWSAGSLGLNPVNRGTTDDLGHYRFSHLLPGAYAIGVVARPWWVSLVSQPVVVSRSGAQMGSSSAEFALPSLQLPPSAAANPALDLVYPVTYFPNAASLADAAKLSLQPGATETADVTLRPVPSIHLHVRVPPAASAPANDQSDAADGEQSDAVQIDSGTSVDVVLNVGGEDSTHIQGVRAGITLGLFEVSGIPPGDVTVIVNGARSDGDATNLARSLQLSADTDIDFSPHGQLADVSGVVLIPQDLANDPRLPDEASLFMIRFRSSKTGETYETTVSKKGVFSFAASALPPGTFEVSFADDPTLQVTSLDATGATVSHRTIDITSGEPVRLTVHTAEAKCSLTGIALKDGKPFVGAMILLVPQDPDQNAALFHRDQSDSDGSFAMAPLFPGRYTLLAIENGWDLEWSDPAVLFQYLPNGLPVELQPNVAANLNAKVQ